MHHQQTSDGASDAFSLKLPCMFWTDCCVEMVLQPPEDGSCFSVCLFKFQTLDRLTPVDTVAVYSESCKTQTVKIACSSTA